MSAGGSDSFTFNINAVNLSPGDVRTGRIRIYSNDPDENPTIIEVTLTVSQADFDLTISLDPIPTDDAQRGTNVQINCTVYRTGGLLRPTEGYVRVFVYMNQDQDPNNISQQDLILGDAGDESFDFPAMDLDDGSEAKPKNVTMPDKDGPLFLHVKVDGPEYWSESDETNNFASSTSSIATWRPGVPPPEEQMGVVARTWDNPDIYWIKYGKK